MLRKLFCVAVIAGAGLLVLSAPSPAQKDKKVEKTDLEIRDERMQKLTSAYEMAAAGRDKQAPEFLIAAASILRELSQFKELQPENLQPEITDDQGVVQPAAKAVKTPSLLEESDEMYRDAKDMAAIINVNVDKLVAKAKTRVDDEIRKNAGIEKRAVVGGPKSVAAVVKPGQTATYRYTLMTHAFSQWFFNSVAPLTVSVRRADDNQPYYFGVTTYASRVWHPHWHPNPKIDRAPIIIQVQNFSKQPVQFKMMIQ
jgi:hypothetical protein